MKHIVVERHNRLVVCMDGVFRWRVGCFLTFFLVGAVGSWAQNFITMVAADDGTGIATYVYFPDGDEPWPVLLTRTPYGGGQNHRRCMDYATLGYACVVQDGRGWGQSEGEPDFLLEGADGAAAVRWIAAQSWCDGRVGTFGQSAAGEAQYRLAPEAPDALECMSSWVSSADTYHTTMFQGGAFREELVAGWTISQGIPDVIDLFLAHRMLDEWWDPVQPIDRVDQIRAAGLHLGGWYDLAAQGTLDTFSALQTEGGEGARGEQMLIMAPRTHGWHSGYLFYPSNAGFNRETVERAWLAFCLLGEANEVVSWPAVSVYLMGPASSFIIGIPEESNAPGNVWVALPDWPPPAQPLHLYLGRQGSLGTELSLYGELELLMNPEDPVETNGGSNLFCTGVGHIPASRCGPMDQRSIEERDDVIVFTTDELSSPVTIMGRVTAHLWIRPDTTDLDLAVRLTDVYPTGHSMLVIDGIQRARMRCGDDHECLLTPGVPVEISVDLGSTALVFSRGHRIRISVSGSNWPRFEINPNHGGDLDGDGSPVLARPELLFGPDFPARLELPLWTPAPRQAEGRGSN